MIASLAVTALLGLSACGSSSGDEPSDNSVSFGYWSGGTGYLGMLPEVVKQNPKLAEGNGLKIEAVPYENLQELYFDVGQGRVDIALASPDAAAGQTSQGAPVGVIGTLAKSTTGIVGKRGDLTVDRLKGSRVAMANAGVARLVRAQLEEKFGLMAGKEYEVLPAQDNAQAISQVAAGTADFAMSWEPHTTRAIEKFGLELVASPADLAFEDHASWQFVIYANNDLGDDLIKPVMDTIADAGKWMKSNPDEMDKMAVGFGQEPGTIKELIASGRSPIEVHTMTDEIQSAIEADFQVLVETGGLEEMPPAEVFRK